MGELRPLADDLNDDCRRFAQALRTLFTGLDVSVRRYAVRRYRNAGTVSRYLSGTRVPPGSSSSTSSPTSPSTTARRPHR